MTDEGDTGNNKLTTKSKIVQNGKPTRTRRTRKHMTLALGGGARSKMKFANLEDPKISPEMKMNLKRANFTPNQSVNKKKRKDSFNFGMKQKKRSNQRTAVDLDEAVTPNADEFNSPKKFGSNENLIENDHDTFQGRNDKKRFTRR
jgi:hypothetical protein